MDSPVRHTLPKSERLSRKFIIAQLLGNRQSLSVYPFRFHWLITPLPLPVQYQVILFVPRRKFRKAHQRNEIKRLLRELFRQHNHPLRDFLSNKNMQCALAVSYLGHSDEKRSFGRMSHTFEKAIQTLVHEIEKTAG